MTYAIARHGISRAARYVEDATKCARGHLQESAALGMERLLHDELAEVWSECREPNWDGYGALPVSPEALRNMYVFLEALPLGFPKPGLGADPFGHLSVEWYRSPSRTLSVAVSDDGLLHYAALLGANRASGTETFYGEIPEEIYRLVQRVYS